MQSSVPSHKPHVRTSACVRRPCPTAAGSTGTSMTTVGLGSASPATPPPAPGSCTASTCPMRRGRMLWRASARPSTSSTCVWVGGWGSVCGWMGGGSCCASHPPPSKLIATCRHPYRVCVPFGFGFLSSLFLSSCRWPTTSRLPTRTWLTTQRCWRSTCATCRHAGGHALPVAPCGAGAWCSVPALCPASASAGLALQAAMHHWVVAVALSVLAPQVVTCLPPCVCLP